MSFSGIIPALITPFTASNDVDADALSANVRSRRTRATGFVANGTMGEAGSLTKRRAAARDRDHTRSSR